MSIKVGELAVVKTTGEPVFVLGIRELGESTIVLAGEETPEGKSFTAQAKVRRPVSSRNGIMHFEEYFYIEELETEEESTKRKYDAMLKMQEDLMPNSVPELPDLSTEPVSRIN